MILKVAFWVVLGVYVYSIVGLWLGEPGLPELLWRLPFAVSFLIMMVSPALLLGALYYDQRESCIEVSEA